MSTYEIAAEDCDLLTEETKVDIESLVKAKLLPMPKSASRILELIQNVNVTTGELSEVISYDPVLASRVMRLANSPVYSMQRSVSTVQSAVSAVGVRSIYDIVMLGVAADSFSKDMRSLRTGVSIWEHSVAVALASRKISEILNLRGTEEAFTCGLLHDIGRNLLYQADEIRYTEVDVAEDEDCASALEKQIFGFTHSQVGFYVSRRWGLADAVSSTILFHHDAKKAVEAVAICNIVSVADDLATMKGMGLHMDSPDMLPNSSSVNMLQLTEEQMEQVWESTEKDLSHILKSC